MKVRLQFDTEAKAAEALAHLTKEYNAKVVRPCVIFRKYKNGDIIAVFPYEIETYNGEVMCYEHVGQHGHGDYNVIVSNTSLATPEEYEGLLKELESIGYKNLKIQKKINNKKYLKEWRKLSFQKN